MRIDKEAFLADLEEQRLLLAQECPDELAGSYRNQDETIILGAASSDASRIKILGTLARDGRVDPNNGLFFFDLARHFDDPRMVKDAQRVAQYEQLPKNILGIAERMVRRVVHPSMNQYIS